MKIYYCFSRKKGLDSLVAKNKKEARNLLPKGYKLYQDLNEYDKKILKKFMEAWGKAIDESWAFKNWDK